MKVMKEPEILLFGRKILLPRTDGVVAGGREYSGEPSDCGSCLEVNRVQQGEGDREKTDEDQAARELCETISQDYNKDQNPKTPSIDEDNEQSDDDTQQETLKKPDKILPCPRCNSKDTKFCYYNNYNVKQPRHFCKSCQRYWTAGGSMRNVPVGAGRRKNKNSASHFRQLSISTEIDASKPNATILSFGPHPSVSLPSNMNLADKRVNQLPLPVPCIPGVPWSFPLPAFCPPGYPMPFYPAPYWNCGVVPNAWIPVPSPSTTDQNAATSNPTSPLGKHSRNGELRRQDNNLDGKEYYIELKINSESSILVPKTLRMDDPEEAAKSSLWETLGIKYDSISISREGLFKALQPKGDEKKSTANTSPSIYANPAALSRSLNFQERA